MLNKTNLEPKTMVVMVETIMIAKTVEWNGNCNTPERKACWRCFENILAYWTARATEDAAPKRSKAGHLGAIWTGRLIAARPAYRARGLPWLKAIRVRPQR